MKDYIALAAQYQADVLEGREPACKWVKLACERNRRDLDRQESPDFPYRFDPERGRRICQMAEMMPHVKGPKAKIVGYDDEGRPVWATIELEPWQCWIFTTLFGWVRVDDERRRFRVSLILIPRKNAKSTIAAVVVLFMLTADNESGAECYSAAKTRDQAKTIAEIAWEMARRSPGFREHFGVRMGSETTKSLSVPANGSKFMPLCSDAHSLDGLNVHLAAIDELHAHPTAAVWNVLDTATGAREQPLLFAITTAGVDIGGVCRQKLDYLEKVLDFDGPIKDEAFFGINYTIDPGDNIRDEVVQRKANPNFGVSVFPDDLQRKVSAGFNSPAELNNVLTKHFNVWIRTESTWMTATKWQACTNARWASIPSYKDRRAAALEEWKNYPCWIGVDLGEVRDYSACDLLFHLGTNAAGENLWGNVIFVYIPEDGVANSRVAQLSGWVREDAVIVTPGSEADYARIEADLLHWDATLKVQEVDFDRRSARLMLQDFRAKLEPKYGKDRVEQMVIDVPQSVDVMDPAMKMAERIVEGGRLQHDGNPAMAWMVSNIVVERNHKDEIYPRKAGGKDSDNKIDGPVAFFTGLSQAMRPRGEAKFQMFFAGGGKK
jgi:phage terminase large subunit-like protein